MIRPEYLTQIRPAFLVALFTHEHKHAQAVSVALFYSFLSEIIERLESGLAHAYDVIEIRVPNKKNFQFGVMGRVVGVGLESWTWTQVGLESDFLRTWTGLGLVEGQGLGLGLGLEG